MHAAARKVGPYVVVSIAHRLFDDAVLPAEVTYNAAKRDRLQAVLCRLDVRVKADVPALHSTAHCYVLSTQAATSSGRFISVEQAAGTSWIEGRVALRGRLDSMEQRPSALCLTQTTFIGPSVHRPRGPDSCYILKSQSPSWASVGSRAFISTASGRAYGAHSGGATWAGHRKTHRACSTTPVHFCKHSSRYLTAQRIEMSCHVIMTFVKRR
jgi:hypothetical protein